MSESQLTPIENVYVKLATIQTKLEKFIKQTEIKLDERKRGVYFKREDLLEFISINEIITNLIEHDLPYITQKLNCEQIERSKYEGKYQQCMSLLEKCYHDYLNCGRQDAIHAITNGLADQTDLSLKL